VEKINGAVLLVSGEDDQMWPSTYFSNLVMERLERNSFPHPYQHLSYPGAGPASMAPYGPLPPSHSLHPVDHQDYAYGGNPKDQAFATEDSWRRVLEFFKTNLAPTSGY
jgi:dienelactone hydrolase